MGRGKSDVSETALAVIELQNRLPDGRVLYSSATAATEVMNFAYATRLGLWGPDTPFPDPTAFVTQIGRGGVAAMEQLACDLKRLGVLCARSLSFDGVEYDRIEHVLSGDQRDVYNLLARAWQLVLRNMHAALLLTANTGEKKADGSDKVDGRSKSAAMSAFWGAHQRFFNQVLTASQMPSVIDDIEKQLAAGNCAVLQLVNTNEASQERAIAKLGEDDDLEDLDMTPRDQLIQLVEHCFPVAQQEPYLDDSGKTQMRPVVDSKGNPVLNKEAVAMRESLMNQIATVRVPEGPLEILLNHFGENNVAEVTGRTRRIVRVKRDGVERTEIQTRSQLKTIAETAEFQAGKRNILVFSDAGGTGASYHADRKAKNQKRRVHYLIQAGWVADQAVQGFGRTHRSDQVTTPLYKLVSTDLCGQKRFLSSIARRLDQLGALTKGQRQTTTQGLFTAADNLESQYARDALRKLYRDLYDGKVEGIGLDDFQEATGLSLLDNQGNLKKELPPITQFLNRLLSLEIDQQNLVFEAFDVRHLEVVQRAMDEGIYDCGVETLRADRIAKVKEQVIYTHPTGAEAKHVELRLGWKTEPRSFDTMLEQRAGTAYKNIAFWARNVKSGHVYAFTLAGDRTDTKSGRVEPHYHRISPNERILFRQSEIQEYDYDETSSSYSYRGAGAAKKRWEVIEAEEARAQWDKQFAAVPEWQESTLHLFCGLLLPVHDRLPAEHPRIKKLQTDKGERLLGRVIPADQLDDVLAKFGISPEAGTHTPADVAEKLKAGTHRFTLANGWTMKSSRVGGVRRMELLGPVYGDMTWLNDAGVEWTRIDFKGRWFIRDSVATEAIADITATKPVVEAQRVA